MKGEENIENKITKLKELREVEGAKGEQIGGAEEKE
jgi:hypothetical protein